MQLTFQIPANENDLFHEDAFKGSIGTKVDVKAFGGATITDAVVINDGKAVLITVETLEDIDVLHDSRPYRSKCR